MSTVPLELRYSPSVEITRRRLLPESGEVIVHVGDRLDADDVVARMDVDATVQTVDIARGLGISVRAVERAMRVAKGARVEAGQVLARVAWPRLWRGKIVAPCAGIVQGIADGCLFLRQDPRTLYLPAYLPGEVIESYPHRGVAIRAVGALLRGAWGAGPHGSGPLLIMVENAAQTITWDRVSLRHRGAILVAGHVDDSRVLLRARQFGLRGLVAGSMVPALRALGRELDLPLLVTEGMGHIPMAAPLFDLLRSREGQRAVISGRSQEDYASPELIIPLPPNTQAQSLMVVRPIQLGCRVRLTRPPYLGVIAHVVGIPNTPQKTSLGTWVTGADIRLPDGRRAFVPLANMELIG